MPVSPLTYRGLTPKSPPTGKGRHDTEELGKPVSPPHLWIVQRRKGRQKSKVVRRVSAAVLSRYGKPEGCRSLTLYRDMTSGYPHQSTGGGR